MKEYFKFYWKKKFVILFSIILFFALGNFICSYAINNNRQEFSVMVACEGDYQNITDLEIISQSIDRVLSSKGEKLVSESDKKKLLEEGNIYFLDIDGGFSINMKAKYLNFNKSRSVKLGRNICSYLRTEYSFINEDISVITKTFNSYYAGLMAMGIGIVAAIIYLSIIFRFSNKEDIDISDNETIFKSIFHKKYWKLSLNKNLKIKDLCIIAVLFAMIFVGKATRLPSGFGNLGINITYLFFAIICWLYGPIIGLIAGFFSDILGFLLFPSEGVFFFPYTISAMLTGFIYGICFYRTKITFSKVFFSRILVNFIINVLLGSIWNGILNDLSFDATITYMTMTSLPKNILYLVPQSIVLFIVFKALGRVFGASNILDKRICDNISII